MQVSLVFDFIYGDSTEIVTKQEKSDCDDLLNFDVTGGTAKKHVHQIG